MHLVEGGGHLRGDRAKLRNQLRERLLLHHDHACQVAVREHVRHGGGGTRLHFLVCRVVRRQVRLVRHEVRVRVGQRVRVVRVNALPEKRGGHLHERVSVRLKDGLRGTRVPPADAAVLEVVVGVPLQHHQRLVAAPAARHTLDLVLLERQLREGADGAVRRDETARLLHAHGRLTELQVLAAVLLRRRACRPRGRRGEGTVHDAGDGPPRLREADADGALLALARGELAGAVDGVDEGRQLLRAVVLRRLEELVLDARKLRQRVLQRLLDLSGHGEVSDHVRLLVGGDGHILLAHDGNAAAAEKVLHQEVLHQAVGDGEDGFVRLLHADARVHHPVQRADEGLHLRAGCLAAADEVRERHLRRQYVWFNEVQIL
eukprot:Rhum_TRINITY_DN15714_c0_g1::Rhum_TRINITY_DN15714_c0_g1_i1::g.161915::m.161915